MKKALFKDAFIEVRKSKQRFFSILAIVAIGIGFFAGVTSASPDMKETVDAYFKQQHLMDIKVMTSMGLTPEDIAAISETQGVQKVVGSYSKDLIINMKGTNMTAKVMADISENGDGLNLPTLTEGRMPQSADECVVEKMPYIDMPIALGDTITLSTGDDSSLEDSVSQSTFRVVGFATSSQYITYEREKTTLGNGEIDLFVIIPKEDFTLPVFTEAYVRTTADASLNCYSDAYLSFTDDTIKALTSLGDVRSPLRLDELKDTAMSQWKEGEAEYLSSLNEFNTKIAQAQQDLNDARTRLDTGWKEYNDGITQLNAAKAEGQQKLDDAKAQLDSAKFQLEASAQSLQTFKQIQGLILSNQDPIPAIDATIGALQGALAQVAPESEGGKAIAQQIQLLQTVKSYPGNKNDVMGPAVASMEAAYNAGETALAQGNADYSSNKTRFESEIASTSDRLSQAKTDLQTGEETYLTGTVRLQEQREDGAAKLDSAKTRLMESRDEIDKLEAPKWYVFDRDANPGYSEFEMNADRVNAIAKVFPLFFVLVAMLVCLSAMTRMVEEQRTAMGTLKALGYSNRAISMKYLLYAGVASLVGSILGLIIGFQLFPKVIFSAYSILYILPALNAPFRWDIAAVSTVVAVGCTMLAAFFAIRASLRTSSAQLMRPKAPKVGKTILLERIPFLWKRLSFNNKVTARNLFRYKQRMLMTVIGIAGCTALMLTGFGIRDSITSIITLQFGEINRYDLMAIADFDSYGKNDELTQYLTDNSLVASFTPTMAVSYQGVKDDFRSDVSLVVPSNPDIDSFIRLQTRVENTPLSISDEGAIVSEKIAEDMGLSVGDNMTIEVDTFTHREILITGICENYAHNYIYMTPSYYEKVFKEGFKPNNVFINLTEEGKKEEQSFSLNLFKREDVLSVTSVSSLRNTLADAMSGLNLIVWVLIASAGALAFVVLYNLTTININERTREIATIKVLGFYPKEVYSYVFKENVLLTLLGGGVGLFFGIYLTRFVIHTAEMKNFMFARTISPFSFIISFVLTVVFSLVVNLFMRRKLRKIDMVESLKSIE